ncbi:hypothetical protein ANO11243_050070 [Dothideomycetidae sp. 11243]|nr:hypothetical protein ANO11243_050070 [fungal sp. No.11243]
MPKCRRPSEDIAAYSLLVYAVERDAQSGTIQELVAGHAPSSHHAFVPQGQCFDESAYHVCQITACSATGDRHGSGNEDMADTTPEAPNYESPSQSEPDLHYIHILNAAVERSPASTQPQTTSTTPARTRLQNSLTPRNCQSLEHPRLDAFDREYLFNKGVFDLPAPCHLYENF